MPWASASTLKCLCGCVCVGAGMWFVLTSLQCQAAVLVSPRAFTLLVSNEGAGPNAMNLLSLTSGDKWNVTSFLFVGDDLEYFCVLKFHGLQAQGSCLKYSCLQVEDAQESASLVVFSCQTREILEDRPSIKDKKIPNVLRSVICDRLFLTCLLLSPFPGIWRCEETCLCMFTATLLWQIFWKYRLEYLRLEIIAQALNLVQEKL